MHPGDAKDGVARHRHTAARGTLSVLGEDPGSAASGSDRSTIWLHHHRLPTSCFSTSTAVTWQHAHTHEGDRRT